LETKVLLNDFCIDCLDLVGDNFYTEDNKTCKETCRNGQRLTNLIECDDGNTDNGDGCNNDCTI